MANGHSQVAWTRISAPTTGKTATKVECPLFIFESISLNEYYGCIRWGVAYRDFDQEDPRVSTYAFIQRQNGFVPRKSYGRAPVTQLALHCVLKHTPWLHGWKDYTYSASELTDAKGFLEELPRMKGTQVSEPFGSVTFIEGNGWMAYVVNGYCHFGPQKFLRLYFTPGIRLRDIPKPIRDLVELKSTGVRVQSSP